MTHLEYLLSYGVRGEFGRFRAARPLECRRGDRAVIRSHRGLEIGAVLREATPRHAPFLPNTTVGQLVRLATPEDEHTDLAMRELGHAVLTRGNHVASEMGLPLEVVDVELLLDRQNAVLHHVRWQDCDVRPFVSTLAREFAVQITLTEMGRAIVEPEEAEHGCGREGCGSESGGCGSCGSGGCGTCGTAKPEDVKAHFAGLREHMEHRRTTLL